MRTKDGYNGHVSAPAWSHPVMVFLNSGPHPIPPDGRMKDFRI
jgi:hypothetical protein